LEKALELTKDKWNRNIVLFLISQTVTLFGSYLVQYAILWHITLRTQSGIMMTIAIICGFLPTFFISPFAGVWADRFSRKTLIILADAFIAVATLILALLFLTGYDALWLLFLVSAIRALGAGVQIPAIGAFIPQMAAGEMLTRVNATMTSIEAMVSLLSPMASGALLTIASIETIFFIDVVTASIAIFILILFLDVPVHAKALSKQATGYFADMREGFKYIQGHKYIRNFFIFCAVFFVLAAPAAFLTPLQVVRSFGSDIWRLTAIEVAFSAGMMLGGVVIAVWGGFKNRIHTMTLACVAFGACTLALGLIPFFFVYLLIMVTTGVTMPMFNTPATVLLQERVAEDYMGRVFGILGMISSIMMPLGMLVFGPLADIVVIEWLLIGTGLLLFIQGFFLLGNKPLLEAGKPVSQADG